MNEEKGKKHRFWRGWWKLLIGLAIFLVVAVAGVLLAIDPIAHALANRVLKQFLPAGGTLQEIDIQIGNAAVEVNGLTINGPHGFGDDALLTLGALRLDVDPLALADGEVAVEQLTVRELSVVLVRDKDGRLSPLALIFPPDKASPGEQPPDTRENRDPPAIPPIRVDRVRLEKISVRVVDYLAGQPWHGRLGIDLSLDDLQLKDVLKQDILLGRLNLSVRDIVIDQPPGYSQTPLLTLQTGRLDAADIDLEKGQMPVETVLMENLKVSLEWNTQGVTNIERLRDAWLEAPAASQVQQDAAAPAPPADREAVKTRRPTLQLKDLRLKDIALRMQGIVEGTPCKAGFERLDIGLTDLMVGDISQKAVSLGSFNLDLEGVAVDQPPGYDKDKLAGLGALRVRTGRLDLAAPVLAVHTVTIEKPTAAVIVRADRKTNLHQWKEALLGPAAAEDDNRPAETGGNGQESTMPLPVVRFDEIKVVDGSLYYRDNAIIKEGLEMPLENARLSVTGLSLFEKDKQAKPAAVEGSFELQQPGELPVARWGARAVVGSVNKIPPFNAQVRFVGFKLDTLGSLIPPATRTALGATGLDTNVSAVINENRINLLAGVLTDRGIKYNAINVHGFLDEPVIEVADIFSGAFNRISDGLVNLGGNTLKAGASVVKGGAHVVGEVGEGVWEVGKNLGVSAFEVGKGVLTLDGEELKEGLSGTTVDTAKITADSAKGTGSSASGGLGDSVSDLKGDHRVQRWEKEIPARYQTAMQRAEEMLAKMPYPPVVED